MAQKFTIAVLGSGPAGMSAGAYATKRGLTHILLEKADHLSDTIYRYQRGKCIMATPKQSGLEVASSNCTACRGYHSLGEPPSRASYIRP